MIDGSKPEFWRSVWEGHRRDRARRGYETESEYVQHGWASGALPEPRTPSFGARVAAGLACGALVFAIGLTCALTGFALGLGAAIRWPL